MPKNKTFPLNNSLACANYAIYVAIHACIAEVSGYWFFYSWSISEKLFAYPILIRKFLKFGIRYPSVSDCDTG